ncbi:hypothetical protein LTR94_033187, partial [Friedmanniomyces endolithicus]
RRHRRPRPAAADLWRRPPLRPFVRRHGRRGGDPRPVARRPGGRARPLDPSGQRTAVCGVGPAADRTEAAAGSRLRRLARPDDGQGRQGLRRRPAADLGAGGADRPAAVAAVADLRRPGAAGVGNGRHPDPDHGQYGAGHGLPVAHQRRSARDQGL